MSTFETVTPPLQTGIRKNNAPGASQGRYVDCDHIRFYDGYPEKIGGWVQYTSSPFLGVARGAHSWNDLTARTQAAFGTNRHLYWIDGGKTPRNITPWVNPSGVSLTTAVNTTSGQTSVSITQTLHGYVPGQFVTFGSSVTVGGLTLSGDYEIQSVPDNNTFKITATAAATSTATSAGSFTLYAELPPGLLNPTGGYGWGVGPWGRGTWGTSRTSTAVTFEPFYWSLGNLGKLLLAAPFGGKLYQFDPTITLARAVDATGGNGPGAMRGFFVTPERYVIALGASVDTGLVPDPMRIRWCTQNDPTDWHPDPDDTSGSRRLTEGKRIMGGANTGSQISLIWTDTSLYVCQYTGSDLVFETRVIGKECGLAGPSAYTIVGGQAYWVSQAGFYLYNGGVSSIPREDEIKKWVFDQLRDTYQTKICCFHVEAHNEVWWTFVPAGQTEPSFYAKVNTKTWDWDHGTLSRTAALTINAQPILASPNGYFYQHEVGHDADGAPLDAWVQTAPMVVDRDKDFEIEGIDSDFARQTGDLTMQFDSYYNSGGQIMDSVTVTIPDAVRPVGSEMEDLRIEGGLISFLLRSNVLGGDFRVGKIGFDMRRIKESRR